MGTDADTDTSADASSDDTEDGDDSDDDTEDDADTDANDDLDDDTESDGDTDSASACVDSSLDSGDDSSDDSTNSTNTDDDANGLSSLLRNQGRESGLAGIFGQNVDGEDAVMDISFSQATLANLWGMATLILVVCLIGGCLYRTAEAKRVRYEADNSPV